MRMKLIVFISLAAVATSVSLGYQEKQVQEMLVQTSADANSETKIIKPIFDTVGGVVRYVAESCWGAT